MARARWYVQVEPAGARPSRSEPPERVRVAFFGLLGYGNIGNDASFETLLDGLRRVRPDVEFAAICPAPLRVERAQGIPARPLRTVPPSAGSGADLTPETARKAYKKLKDFHHIGRVVREFDYVLVPGMGVFESKLGASTPWGLPFDQFALAVTARAAGVKVGYVSVGADAIDNYLVRAFARTAARLAQYRSYRDDYSRRCMVANGVPFPDDPVFPDLVFSLPTPTVDRVEPGLVALGVIDYYGADDDPVRGAGLHRRYIETMTSFVERLIVDGRHVRLLVGDAKDYNTVAELQSAVRMRMGDAADEGVSLASAGTFADVMEEMAPAELAVASRFHNIVAALKLGKPTVSIGYGHKNAVLMSKMGLGEYCQHLDSFDLDTLWSQAEEVTRRHGEWAEELHTANRRFAELLDGQLERLAAEIPSQPQARRCHLGRSAPPQFPVPPRRMASYP